MYKNGNGDSLYKELPTGSLGKLNRGNPTKPVTILARGDTNSEALAPPNANGEEESSSDEVTDEVVLFRGLETEAKAKDGTVPRSGTGPSNSSTVERQVGDPVLDKDLALLTFSNDSAFREGELVVVPRSAGGFTYGLVQKRCECVCPVGPPAHKHSGWRGEMLLPPH